MIRPARLGSLLLLAQLTLIAAPTWAQDKDPDPSTMTEEEKDAAFEQNLEKAGALYEEKKFEDSLVYFKRAYKVRPEPKLLFNMGIISERLGRLEEAVGYYNTFVTSPDVSLELRGQGQKRLDVLRPIVKSQREERERQEREERERQAKLNPTPPDGSNNPNPKSAPKDKPEEPSNAGRIASYVVTGSGIALAGVGGFMLITLDDAQAFAKETTPEDRRIARDSRNTQKSAGTILVAGGATLAVTGIILWALTGQEEAAPPQAASWHITPSLSPSGGAVSIFRRF